MDAEAQADWLEFYNEVEGEQSALGKYANLRPFAGRAGELVRRLATVFACFEGQQQIDGECLRRAAVLVRHSLVEWSRYTDSEAFNPKLKQAAALLEWLQVKSWQSFDSRKLQREGPSIVRKSAKQRDSLLAALVDHNQLLTDDGKHFTINPLAATATPATKHAQPGVSSCDSFATRCDKLRSVMGAAGLSQVVARLSQLLGPCPTGCVAVVAVVASGLRVNCLPSWVSSWL